MAATYERSKRLLDIAIVVGTALATVPTIAALVCLIRLKLGRPVFFIQERAGLEGEVFHLIKFRTMTNAVDARGELLPDEARMTRFGIWLRRTSLDELPSIYNIWRGEMSMVGPRPLPVRYLPRYSPVQMSRHSVRPGLTGLAQVMGRNALTWGQKFRWDIFYVGHASLRLDLWILWKTLWVVLRRTGIEARSGGSMPEFKPGGAE